MEIVEIRNYFIKNSKRNDFHNLVEIGSIPMLNRWGVKVLAFGKSLHDDNSYFLIRKYDSIKQRDESQNAFYKSEEWTTNYDKAIMELIENYTTSVIEIDKFEQIHTQKK
ncbi:NIPSNAP family protein [Flavobacterium sp. GT3P67]|uniref:NIPSNAP family protein n=1 Tax=Flavobacterium sp. GT3P67 TaxID=2541722 RepID=UPI0010509150|nr:NIPSNAP family protein [Flavobacterium sp. GT3P67]TDE48410.1 NIPSNAP family protein [Flavobacterium sp. GT3P67]